MRKITHNPQFWYNPIASKAYYYYASEVIKERWYEVEPYIIKNPKYACLYAQLVIRNRWHEAEPIIMKNPKYAYWYAHYVIIGRWHTAEPFIKGSPYQKTYENWFKCQL